MKIFKEYIQNQTSLFPPTTDELISPTHPVRMINTIVDSLEIKGILRKYKGGGNTSYHPRMLLKVLFYSYMNNVYSSRKIEQLLHENIYYIYLSGKQTPDHNTINRFRGKRLAGELKKVFVQITEKLSEHGLLSLREVYVDGTKIEANANRYSFIWGNTIRYNKERMARQLEELWSYSLRVAKEESEDRTKKELRHLSPEEVKSMIEEINTNILKSEEEIEAEQESASEEAESEKTEKEKTEKKKIKQKLKYCSKNWPKNLQRYEEQEEQLAGRKSMSRIDTDATFMRMKEDHMNKGELKAGYNVQLAVNEQIIVEYGIYPNPTDTRTLPKFVEQIKEDYQRTPSQIIADAGYGSEENYEYLKRESIQGIIKYNTYEKEQKKVRREKKPFIAEKLHYNKEKNYYVCPMGQKMLSIGKTEEKNESGYIQQKEKYRAENCSGCSLRSACYKGRGNRVIEVNHNLQRLKEEVREVLQSEEGKRLYAKRKIEVEPVFGNIKQNKGFRRFMLRGKEKVNTEFGLIAIAHNLSKAIKFFTERNMVLEFKF